MIFTLEFVSKLNSSYQLLVQDYLFWLCLFCCPILYSILFLLTVLIAILVVVIVFSKRRMAQVLKHTSSGDDVVVSYSAASRTEDCKLSIRSMNNTNLSIILFDSVLFQFCLTDVISTKILPFNSDLIFCLKYGCYILLFWCCTLKSASSWHEIVITKTHYPLQ